MTDPRTRTRTRVFVFATLAALAVWTAVMWVVHGGRATVSSVFGWAFSWRYAGWWMIGTFGFVCGHLTGMTEHDATGYWWRVAVYVAAWVLGFWLTWRMP